MILVLCCHYWHRGQRITAWSQQREAGGKLPLCSTHSLVNATLRVAVNSPAEPLHAPSTPHPHTHVLQVHAVPASLPRCPAPEPSSALARLFCLDDHTQPIRQVDTWAPVATAASDCDPEGKQQHPPLPLLPAFSAAVCHESPDQPATPESPDTSSPHYSSFLTPTVNRLLPTCTSAHTT